MAEHKVTWTIDIDADTPWQAAEQAREIMLDPCSTATFFTVLDENGYTHEIGLPVMEDEYETR